jgi:hypothetical protein
METIMKAILTLAAALAVAATASPALAKSKKKITVYPGAYYGATYAPYGFWNGIPGPVVGGWHGNDPSLGHPSAASLSRASGRCVEDLGYGRFKYCGW